MIRSYGVKPPPGLEWQIGKTAASIIFVNAAEQYIADCTSPSEITFLQDFVDEIKSGKRVLHENHTVQSFLQSNNASIEELTRIVEEFAKQDWGGQPYSFCSFGISQVKLEDPSAPPETLDNPCIVAQILTPRPTEIVMPTDFFGLRVFYKTLSEDDRVYPLKNTSVL